jgi:hypothetical protein
LKILENSDVGPDTKIKGVEHNPDGSLNGVFIEMLAVQAALGPVFGEIMELGGVQGLHFMGDIARSVGITTTSELAFGAIDFDQEWKDTVEATSDPKFSVRLRLVPIESALHHKYGDGAVAAQREMTALPKTARRWWRRASASGSNTPCVR